MSSPPYESPDDAHGSSMSTNGIFNQASNALNGSWCPRWAVYDGQGRLTYLAGIGDWEEES